MLVVWNVLVIKINQFFMLVDDMPLWFIDMLSTNCMTVLIFEFSNIFTKQLICIVYCPNRYMFEKNRLSRRPRLVYLVLHFIKSNNWYFFFLLHFLSFSRWNSVYFYIIYFYFERVLFSKLNTWNTWNHVFFILKKNSYLN